MSGICAAWSRSGAPVDAAAFERMLAASRERAVDGVDAWAAADGSVRLAHQHFWVTPEEVGERQPCARGDVVVAFDGRLDNRDELAAGLGLSARDAAAHSDAALVLRAYERWAEECVARLLGPFALVVWDGRLQRLVGARDRLGRRALYYRLTPDLLLIASEPRAILAWPAATHALDDVFLAHHFALRSPPEGRTLFVGVRSVLPAHRLIVAAAGDRLERYGALQLRRIRHADDEAFAEELRHLLDRAVRRRMRTADAVGVLMSGGLDSTSVAALAARQLRRDDPGARLKVFSYVFDALVELDERRWMAPMVERYGLDQTLVTADDAWPLHDVSAWRWNAGGPDVGPFASLNDRLFAAARGGGPRVLLTGAAADGLFVGAASWLADLVAAGRYREAASEVLRFARHVGWRRVARSTSVRRLAAGLVHHEGRRLPPPPWMTPWAAAQLRAAPDAAARGTSWRRRSDVQEVVEALVQDDGILGGSFVCRPGVEVWDPFADVDVVEFMLSIPAYLLYNQAAIKAVLLRALAPALPDVVVQRSRRSDISPLFQRGVGVEGASVARDLLRGTDVVWPRFVRSEWLTARQRDAHAGGSGALVLWRCLTFEWWARQAREQGTGGTRRERDDTT